MDDALCTISSFIPIKTNNNHIGFVSFIYHGLLIRNVAVWEKMNKNGYKCVYPKDRIGRNIIIPKNAEIQNNIDYCITNYIKKEVNNGCNDKSSKSNKDQR